MTAPGAIERTPHCQSQWHRAYSPRNKLRNHAAAIARVSNDSSNVSGDVFRAVFNAAKPAADPPLRGTLFDLAPIP